MGKKIWVTVSAFIKNEIKSLCEGGRKVYSQDITGWIPEKGWEDGDFKAEVLHKTEDNIFIDAIRREDKPKPNEPCINVLRMYIDERDIQKPTRNHSNHWPTGSTFTFYTASIDVDGE